uniref:Skp1-related protein n=1 Tax=Caenorhabditis tropicalis TaxID=1561998 RepID=A0A1I7TN86_9PELO
MSTTPLYKLKTEDGQIVEVERKLLKFSTFINQKLIDAGCTDANCKEMEPIAVPCHSEALRLVIRWLNKHHTTLPKTTKVKYDRFSNWDKEFFKMETPRLFGLISASYALGIEDLMNMGCSTAAQLIKGKSTAEIRQIYGIKSDKEQMEEALANGGEGTSTATFTYDSD